MGKLLPDPELERLVAEMNRMAPGEQDAVDDDGTSRRGAMDAPGLRQVAADSSLERLLTEMIRRQASDLVLVPGSRPMLRVAGELLRLDAPEVDEASVRELFEPHLGERSRAQLERLGATDLSLRLTGAGGTSAWRLRVNLQRQRGELAAAIRALPRAIPALADLGLPDSLADLVRPARGLVLVCGPTGSGKSTTLAALVDLLNREQARHVITIEDPVEYEHASRRSVVEQVEVGSDAPSFSAALRAALRRDPDVLLVGEMRDLETMSITVTAAETGHLVLATLHTHDSAQAVHRIVDSYPAEQQTQVRQQLALSLTAIVCQQLLPAIDGRGRVPAVELLVATYAVRNHIRQGALHRLYNEIQSGRRLGMATLEASLAALVSSGRVSAEEAVRRAARPDELERLLGGRLGTE